MSKEQKGGTVIPPVKVPLYQSSILTIWSTELGANIITSLEVSIKDVQEHWNNADHGVSSEMFKDDEKGVKALMKKYGYYPHMVNGKHLQGQGAYYFQHYTRKKKVAVDA